MDLAVCVQVLGWVKDLFFIVLFVFSTSYLIPKGIVAFAEWKERRVQSQLATGVTFWAGGICILVYLLSTLIMP